jgi:hypothetical protein
LASAPASLCLFWPPFALQSKVIISGRKNKGERHTVDEYDIEGRVDSSGDLINIKFPQIGEVGEFLQIASERDPILVRRSWDVINHVVELLEA